MLARAEVGEVKGQSHLQAGRVVLFTTTTTITIYLIFTKMTLVTLVTVKEWLMELRATAISDDDTEHISGWSLFFQCNADAKAALKAV